MNLYGATFYTYDEFSKLFTFRFLYHTVMEMIELLVYPQYFSNNHVDIANQLKMLNKVF